VSITAFDWLPNWVLLISWFFMFGPLSVFLCIFDIGVVTILSYMFYFFYFSYHYVYSTIIVAAGSLLCIYSLSSIVEWCGAGIGMGGVVVVDGVTSTMVW
jgi:hypothetical protein